MIRYATVRTLESLALVVGVVVLTFFLVRLTGDPVALMVPKDAPNEQREAFAQRMGFDRPTHVQLFEYVWRAVRGDLGESLRQKRPAIQIVAERIYPTVQLALGALLFTSLVAVPLGLAAGMAPGSWIDRMAVAVGLAGQTIPSYWLAMVSIVVFAVHLGWFPAFGRDSWSSLVLPSVALGFAGMGQALRLMRSTVIDVRRSDFLTTARAKGAGRWRIAWGHVLPNVALPFVSVMGVQLTYLLGGSVYVEVIFAWPGLGTLLETAVRDADFPLVQAITLALSAVAIGLHLVTDLAYAALDPRIRSA